MYRVGGAVHLAPRPGRVWVTHRLAVEHCILPLVFVLTPLVAGDVRLCCRGKNKTERLVGCVVGGKAFKNGSTPPRRRDEEKQLSLCWKKTMLLSQTVASHTSSWVPVELQ